MANAPNDQLTDLLRRFHDYHGIANEYILGTLTADEVAACPDDVRVISIILTLQDLIKAIRTK